MKPNLMKLMYAGYFGGSMLKGEEPYWPYWVERALKRVFAVVKTERTPGTLDFEFRCYDHDEGDDDLRMRLRIQYGWCGNGWRYEPVAVRKNTRLPRAGDVVYLPDGGYRIAA